MVGSFSFRVINGQQEEYLGIGNGYTVGGVTAINIIIKTIQMAKQIQSLADEETGELFILWLLEQVQIKVSIYIFNAAFVCRN